MEGRSLIREATLEGYRQDPKFAEDETPLFSLWTGARVQDASRSGAW